MKARNDSARRSFLSVAACAIVLVGLPFLVFWPVALGRQIWAGGDFSTLHYPYFVANSEQWRQGQVPLWNPYIYAGTPLAASQEGSTFYPLNIVLWLTMPPSLAMGYSVLVHLALTGVAMFTFLRSLPLHPAAALLGGLTLQFGGFAMSHLGHLVILRALPWIGFGLCCYNRWADSRCRCFLAGIAASVGMLWLSGHPQTILYSTLLVGTYFAFGRRVGPRVVLPGLGAAALGVALSAIQVLPGLSMWLSREYCTLNECGPEAHGLLSLHPAYLLTLLFPSIRQGTYAEMVGYVGVAALLLAGASLLYREEPQRARTRGFFALWAVVALFLSLGRFVPFLSAWLALVPIYGDLSRVPSRHLLEFGCSMAVLAALGLDGLIQGRSLAKPGRTALAALFVVLAILVALAVLSPYSQDVPPLHWDWASFRMTWQPMLLSLVTVVLLLAMRRFRSRRQASTMLLALLGLALADLVSFGAPIYAGDLTTRRFYETTPAPVRAIREARAGGPFRVVSLEAMGDRNKALLAPNYSVVFGIESLIGSESLMLRRYYDLFRGALPSTGYVEFLQVQEPYFRALADYLGVAYLLARPDSGSALAQHYVPVSVDDEVVVYRNPGARPRLYMAPVMKPDQSQRFGDSLVMVGYAVESSRETPDHRLVTWWRCDRPMAADYTLFVHYLDSVGRTLAQDDHRLGKMAPAVEGATSSWACPGYFSDESRVPPEAWEGDSLLVRLGLWVPETGERLVPSGGLPVDQYGSTRLQFVGARLGGGEVAEQGGERKSQAGPAFGSRAVQVIRYTGGQIQAVVEGEQDGILVHSTLYVPGWRVTVDGKTVPLLQVDGFLQGALVPEGRHVVQFWYQPATFGLGAGTTLASLAVVIALLLWPKWKRRKTDHPADRALSPWQEAADG